MSEKAAKADAEAAKNMAEATAATDRLLQGSDNSD
jgi:hypothetical protein